MRIVVPDRMFFRIGEVADLIDVKPYVLRFWESQFPGLTPQKSSSGQRVYRRTEVEMLVLIRHLLYTERYSIEGARRRLKELRKQGKLSKFKKETLGVIAGGEVGEALPQEVDAALDLLAEAKQVGSEGQGTAFVPAGPLVEANQEFSQDSGEPKVLAAAFSAEKALAVTDTLQELKNLLHQPLSHFFKW
jgi:DNA-binding transcriptional MerR regulator